MKKKKQTVLQRELQKTLVDVPNRLEYAQLRTLAVINVKCEKFLTHQFDGTEATHMVMVKFERSEVANGHALCEECANELMSKLAPPM